ncbi:MAG: His/Gly/Thr/Pro-type tRNA ligase C-terminal domain-containing protein, partial [Syntrophales bacterium]|nr:His/Gly/Thr/Pro-type tRNA ligase C-terminal domain-containing protein [Syntrophales bacterium]
MSMAPYHVIITPVNMNDTALSEAASRIYEALLAQDVEAVLDDRDERAGVKFKDADLVGFPLRITVGPKRLAEGKVEVKDRRTGQVEISNLDEAVNYVVKIVKEA